MSFSIWEYLRARTRDAVLAGIQDAMDIAEQGDTNGSQHVAAKQLASRLSQPDAKQLTAPGVNGDGAQPASEPQEAPTRPADASAFDDELQRRLDAAAPQSDPETPTASPPAGRLTDRKRRGRPPKNRQGEK